MIATDHDLREIEASFRMTKSDPKPARSHAGVESLRAPAQLVSRVVSDSTNGVG